MVHLNNQLVNAIEITSLAVFVLRRPLVGFIFMLNTENFQRVMWFQCIDLPKNTSENGDDGLSHCITIIKTKSGMSIWLIC